MDSWKVCYDLNTEEVKLWPRLLMIMHGVDGQPECGQLQHDKPFLDICEGQWVTKPSQWAEVGLLYLIIHSVELWKEILVHGSV